ncbi:hypothetical protein RvY_02163 [Ramazzottius varieornatus]|uniref:Uncharacterized protein n=1 Tax=Ramazzottius varieornatus TaxID=947166 RepID=A0A1D1UTD7_RAMVA|nr:hypothetical protein RvY_02163 [Ramazzottius varieornatus]
MDHKGQVSRFSQLHDPESRKVGEVGKGTRAVTGSNEFQESSSEECTRTTSTTEVSA